MLRVELLKIRRLPTPRWVFIVTFLAVLELTRLKKLSVRQDATFAEIQCSAWREIPLESPAP